MRIECQCHRCCDIAITGFANAFRSDDNACATNQITLHTLFVWLAAHSNTIIIEWKGQRVPSCPFTILFNLFFFFLSFVLFYFTIKLSCTPMQVQFLFYFCFLLFSPLFVLHAYIYAKDDDGRAGIKINRKPQFVSIKMHIFYQLSIHLIEAMLSTAKRKMRARERERET